VITVLTTPRRQDYLRETLQSIDDAGAATLVHKTVFVDGDKNLVRKHVPHGWQLQSCHVTNTSRGSRLSLWRILHTAAEARVPNLLHFEDDIRLCKNAIPTMMAIEVPADVGFLSFFQQNKNMPGTHGFHCIPNGQKWWGNQALKIPARSLAKFLDVKSKPADPTPIHQADVWLGERLRGCVLLPSIVRHVGLVTTIPSQKAETLSGDSIHRAGLHYVGDTYDALLHPYSPFLIPQLFLDGESQ